MKISVLFFGVIIMAFVPNLGLGECSSYGRTIYASASPASMNQITITNPSSTSQYVSVTVTAKGSEQIYNAHVASTFGVCVYTSGACSWQIPNGSSFTCTPYSTCTASFSLAANGGMKTLGFGSQLDMARGDQWGYAPLHSGSPDSGTLIKISVCEKTGFLLGRISAYWDDIDNYIPGQINGGRPF